MVGVSAPHNELAIVAVADGSQVTGIYQIRVTARQRVRVDLDDEKKITT